MLFELEYTDESIPHSRSVIARKVQAILTSSHVWVCYLDQYPNSQILLGVFSK